MMPYATGIELLGFSAEFSRTETLEPYMSIASEAYGGLKSQR